MRCLEARALRSAAKNSFDSLAITAGSGRECKEANGFSLVGIPEASVGTSTTKGLFVLMILFDIDIFQEADGVFGQSSDRAIE